MSAASTVRRNILAQGFCDVDEGTCARINYALRLSPAICMIWTAIGTFLQSPLVLGALVPFAVLGAILPGHPFDILYNHGLRHLNGGPPLPRYGARRHFACGLAAAMLTGAAWAFAAGMPTLGSVLGSLLVAAAFVNVSTGFCIPSFLVRLLFGKVACDQPGTVPRTPRAAI
jgi:hypothetical protein